MANASGFLSLFLHGGESTYSSGALALFTHGNSGVASQFGGLDLFINGAAVTGCLPLFIHADYNPSGILPLYISGSNSVVANSLQLFIQQDSAYSGLPLFIQGLQLTQGFHLRYPSDGFIPLTGALPLYIERPEANMLPLYIAGHLSSSGSLNLYLESNPTVTSGLQLFAAGGIDSLSNSLKLYSHGF